MPTFLVTTASDAGPGSLRDAIILANGNDGLDTIAFDTAGGEGCPMSRYRWCTAKEEGTES